ncbi:MAG: alpha/beta hydrolase [Arenicellales bacterium]
MPIAKTRGFETYYEISGSGPPLLLIAGNGMDHSAFNEQLPEFSRHFTCITYDLRSIGASTELEPGYTSCDLADDAIALLETLDFLPAHVAGYSLGGAVAQEMAIEHGDAVCTLSLYSTYDRVEPFLRLRYDLLVKILNETSPDIWAMFTAFSAFGQEYVNTHEAEVREEIGRRAARWRGDSPPSRRGLEGHYQAVLSHDASKRLSRIACPTFIAVGADDPVTPPMYAHRLHAAIPASELMVFEGKPHRLLSFGAERFTEAALRFLLRYRSGTR